MKGGIARIAALALMAWSLPVHAVTIQTYSDQATFLAATGATAAAPIPNNGLDADGQETVGTLTYSLGPGAVQLYLGTGDASQWTTRNTGHDIALSGFEDLDVDIASSVFSLGFEFVEPEFDPNVNAPFEESTYEVTLKDGATTIGSFSYSRPNDSLQFVGVWTDTAFNRVEIVETIGNNENEFFGQFYTGVTAIPEPGVVMLFVSGLALAGLFLRGARIS